MAHQYGSLLRAVEAAPACRRWVFTIVMVLVLGVLGVVTAVLLLGQPINVVTPWVELSLGETWKEQNYEADP